MSETLLLTLREAAEQLRVSTRTVHRLIHAGELPTVPVRRSLRIRRADLRAYVDGLTAKPHNAGRAGPGVRKEGTCHTDAKIVLFGGHLTPTRMERELDALLQQPKGKKPTP